MSVLLDVTVRTSVVLAAGLVARLLVRRRSASLRHGVLTTALLAAAAVVPLSYLLPVWTIPVVRANTISSVHTARAADERTPAATPRYDNVPISRSAHLPLALSLWALAAAANGGMLLFGIARLARITARAQPLDEARWKRLADDTRAEYGVRRPIALLETDAPDALATWGFFRPCLLLPRHARGWDDERVRIVLRHEVAHIRRNDWIVQIGAELIRCVYCFNPLAWIACRRLRQDSEYACDDRVLDTGVSPQTYATHLLELARLCRLTPDGARSFPPPLKPWRTRRSLGEGGQGRDPAMPMARPSTLERRISAMLNSNLDRAHASRTAVAAVAALFLVVALPAASLRAGQASPLPLRGSVYDPTGAVMPDVELTIEGANNTAATTRTDAAGRFEFAAIAPGRYVLAASLAGFKTLRYDIELRTARDWDRAITLQVGELQETIMVQAQRLPNTGAAAAAPSPLRVGGNIKVPMKLHDVHPIYPESMRAAGREGVVPIEAIIARDGSVASARVLSAQVHPDFAAAALDAVRQWRFTPTLLNGEPVEVVMNVSVTFRLAE